MVKNVKKHPTKKIQWSGFECWSTWLILMFLSVHILFPSLPETAADCTPPPLFPVAKARRQRDQSQRGKSPHWPETWGTTQRVHRWSNTWWASSYNTINHIISFLVGGWTNPFEKLSSSTWIASPRIGVKIQTVWNHLGITLQGTITYPTEREKENHRLKSAKWWEIWDSSLEGMSLPPGLKKRLYKRHL